VDAWRWLCWLALPAGAQVTFSGDVAPILHRHCVSCHRPGEVAPFALVSYADAARRARQIAEITASRRMPPWLPAPGFGGPFEGERSLSAAQIRTLAQWAAGGAPPGELAEMPEPPEHPGGWRLGKPDLEVRMPEAYAIAAEGPDEYRCFVLPLELPGDRYVRAFEFRPGNRRVVHHALLFTDHSRAARQRDAESPGPGYPCFGAPGFLPGGALGGWTPGAKPVVQPAGVAVQVRQHADLVIQLHFHPTGKPETEQSTVGLYFAAAPPRRRLLDIALGSREIDIPPGATRYRVTDSFTLPVPVELVGVIPHAHYLCREMRGYAVLPSGRRRWLIRIPEWNFDQQDQYRYVKPIVLPAETRLVMEFFYDNSSGNIRNPHRPPRRVVWGPGSADEMAGLHLQAIPVREADIAELTQALWGKFMRAVGGGFYRPSEP
jgi:hypothetical protein